MGAHFNDLSLKMASEHVTDQSAAVNSMGTVTEDLKVAHWGAQQLFPFDN